MDSQDACLSFSLEGVATYFSSTPRTWQRHYISIKQYNFGQLYKEEGSKSLVQAFKVDFRTPFHFTQRHGKCALQFQFLNSPLAG